MRPKMWDGDNGGGKCLMKMRDTFKMGHTWSPGEQEVCWPTIIIGQSNIYRYCFRQASVNSMNSNVKLGDDRLINHVGQQWVVECVVWCEPNENKLFSSNIGGMRGSYRGGSQTMRGMPAKRARW
jgi:hypothetical protein